MEPLSLFVAGWFAALFALLVAYGYVLARLESKHPEFFARLGRPTMWFSPANGSTWRLLAYVFVGAYSPPRDAPLLAVRVFIVLLTVFMLGLLFISSAGYFPLAAA